MLSLYIFITIVIAFTIAVSVWNNIQRKRGLPEAGQEPLARPEGCCGAHSVCEHTEEELKAGAEYFDDEELDRFAHKRSHEYSNEEADEFREVFYTLYDKEKSEWLRSLRLRHIALPQQVKQEMVAMMKTLQQEGQTA